MLLNDIYSFVFRGLLAEEALDQNGRMRAATNSHSLDEKIASIVSLDLLDENAVIRARRMGTVYTAIAAFENSVRGFIVARLSEQLGEEWWPKGVSDAIRKKAESRRDEENKIRWHAPRGDSLINYTEFGDLVSILTNNWSLFEDHLRSLDWARQILRVVERSRNVIMHGGELEIDDIERLGTHIRDWIKQVGA